MPCMTRRSIDRDLNLDAYMLSRFRLSVEEPASPAFTKCLALVYLSEMDHLEMAGNSCRFP